ncbi:HDOD domain-containing protein [Thalassotalea sp. PLHSN55]|uniref:HDOD domain-containing protein n=1 Tax=Thalassotalea sp. PLHSN55 TaxID=3435888 RepID=UPI003F862D76
MNAIEYAEQAQEFFVLSDSFLRIKQLIDDEQSTMDDIADVVLLDPALSGTILKLANSSLYNYQGKIDTVSKAILVLGITEVYNLVIANTAKETFKNIDADNEYLDNFWSYTVDCGLIIKFLGTELRAPNAERLFVLGLLHNLGELVVKQLTPDKVTACHQTARNLLPWQQQQETLGFTFANCTAELLKLWQFPFSLVGPIREQDNSAFDLSTLETRLLYIAKRIAYLMHCSDKYQLSDVLTAEQLASENITEQMVTSARHYCDMERLGILAILSPKAVIIY